MKNTGGKIYDNEYYEKKYKKYKQKYLFLTKNQFGGGQIPDIDIDKIMSFDYLFRLEPSKSNIRDLNCGEGEQNYDDYYNILQFENGKFNDILLISFAKKCTKDCDYTYSPVYAIMNGFFEVNSCIPYNYRPVHIFLNNICKLIKTNKCSQDKGLYRNSKYYEPMVPTITVSQHISTETRDEVYNTYINNIKNFCKSQLSADTNTGIPKIQEYLESTKTYTYVESESGGDIAGDELLNLIIELRHISKFSHTMFSRISHLRTLPIKYLLKNDPSNFDNTYYNKMMKLLETNIYNRLTETIYPFFNQIQDIIKFTSTKKDFDFDAILNAEIIKIKEKYDLEYIVNNLKKFKFANANDGVFHIFDKNNIINIINKLYELISDIKKQQQINPNEISSEDIHIINICANKYFNIYEKIYDVTKAILTYLSYNELNEVITFIDIDNELLKDALKKIKNKNASLEVLATNVFTLQKGCFLCESKYDNENGNFKMMAAEKVNDIYFISLCGFDLSLLATAYDNYTYLSNKDYLDDPNEINIPGDTMNLVLDKFKIEYSKIFNRLIHICKDNDIKHVSLITFGLGAFLVEISKDNKPLFIKKYAEALKEILLKNTGKHNKNITLYLSIPPNKIVGELFREVFKKSENVFFNTLHELDRIDPDNGIKIYFHKKDAKSMAIYLKEKVPNDNVGFVNASDFIALIFGKIGYYTLDGYSDRYAGEEDFASSSTGMLACDDVYTNLGYTFTGKEEEKDMDKITERSNAISKYKIKKNHFESHVEQPILPALNVELPSAIQVQEIIDPDNPDKENSKMVQQVLSQLKEHDININPTDSTQINDYTMEKIKKLDVNDIIDKIKDRPDKDKVRIFVDNLKRDVTEKKRKNMMRNWHQK